MKKSRILVPALGVLILSTAASITGTVAWFTANNSTTISGMNFTTQVSSNILIASSTAGTDKALESAFSSNLSQAVSGILEPVSTVNGVDFFYTVDAKADGDANADVYTAYDPEDTDDFNDAYGTSGAVGYIDYVYELKAVNSSNAVKYITLANLDLVYTGTGPDTSKAARVAMFVQDQVLTAGVVTGYEAMDTTARCIIDTTGAVNQTADYAVSAANAAPTAISIMATTALTSIQVTASSTKYFKVTMRLYLEGEDKTCTNETFLALTDAWRLNAELKLEAAATGSKTEITKFQGKSVALKGVQTMLYYDSVGNNLYRAANREKLNDGDELPTTLLTSDELTALNTAFGSSFAFPS